MKEHLEKWESHMGDRSGGGAVLRDVVTPHLAEVFSYVALEPEEP